MNATSLPAKSAIVLDDENPERFGMKSPADLTLLAIRSLEAHPDFRCRLPKWGIHIESSGNRLILEGRVPSWYLKQLLQETMRRVDGVESVENRVVVVYPSDLKSMA